MLIFEMLIVEFQVLLKLKNIHLLFLQSITEMLLYLVTSVIFLPEGLCPLQKKMLHFSSSSENIIYR